MSGLDITGNKLVEMNKALKINRHTPIASIDFNRWPGDFHNDTNNNKYDRITH